MRVRSNRAASAIDPCYDRCSWIADGVTAIGFGLACNGLNTTSWCAGSASWEAPRSIIWPAAASACSGSIASRPATIAARRTARPASSASPISSIRPTCRWCAAPMSCGASSRSKPRGRCCTSPASPRSARPTARWSAGTLAAARLHDIPHELLAAPELMRRYPAFRLPPHFVGVVQPDGGFVEAEAVGAGDARAGATARRRDSHRRDGPRHRAGERRRAHRDRRRHDRSRRRHRRRRSVDDIAAAGRRRCRCA